MNALFEGADVRSPDWQEGALALFRSIREAGVALDGVVTADQLRTLAQSDCRKLVSFLVRFDATKTMALRLRAFSPGPEIERAIRKGEGRPYLSSHGDAAIQLNGQAQSPERARPLIVCEDLSSMYLVSAQDSPSGRKPEWEQFKTVEAIAAYAKSSEAERATGQISSATSRHILTNLRFGSFLTGRFKELKERFERLSGDQAREGVTSHFKVETMHHSMALTLTVKQGEDGPEFVARLYDPNFTATHIRACTLQPASFATHCMSDYLAEEITARGLHFSDYVAGDDVQGDDAILTILDADLRDREPQEPVCHVSANIRPGATFAFHLLNAGATEAFEKMWGAFQEGPKRRSILDALQALNGESKAYPLLRAWSEGLGAPGAFMAFQFGHAGVIGAFTKTVLELGLREDQMVELLAAKTADSIPGFWVAMSLGHTDAVKTFANAILASDLSTEVKVGLLGANHEGFHGLSRATYLGHAETVKVFIAAVLTSSLSVDEKVSLLAERGADGKTALETAFAVGHVAVIKVFTEAVLESGLPEDRIIELLAARSSDGTPGLFASKRGDNGAVRGFVEAVLGSSLPEASKSALLAARAASGESALGIALQTGRYSMVEAFVDAISSSNLSADLRLNLLRAADTGTDGLFHAVDLGTVKTVSVFIEGVLKSSLPVEAKMSLLAAKGPDDKTALAHAFADDLAGMVQVFAEAVVSSGLPEDRIVELLAARSSDGTPGLWVASKLGDMGAVRAFVSAVLRSSLAEASKSELLSARAASGESALGIALQMGQTKAVKAFVDAIVSSDLSTTHNLRLELLLARDAQRSPGLRAALVAGQSEAVTAYMQAIWNAGLPETQRLQLLLAPVGQDGTPVLEELMKGQDGDALETYVQAVLEARLPDATTVRLLSPMGNLQAAPPETVAVFEEAIGRSRLPLPQRQQVAAAVTRCGVSCTIL